jgi:hypothetical protein
VAKRALEVAADGGHNILILYTSRPLRRLPWGGLALPFFPLAPEEISAEILDVAATDTNAGALSGPQASVMACIQPTDAIPVLPTLSAVINCSQYVRRREYAADLFYLVFVR